MDPTALAHRMRDLYGGTERPKVVQYWDHDREESVQILSSADRPDPWPDLVGDPGGSTA